MHRHNLPHHQYHRSTTHNAIKPPPPQLTPPPLPGQITFKLMCHIFTAGGVIGHSGTIIKLLEQQTSTRIHVDEPLPDSVDRLISVTGSETVSRTFTFMRGDEVEMKWDVSAAQEALIRVLERIFVVEDEKEGETESNGERSCRLVAGKSLIGVILGKGGENVIRIRNQTGTKIRVLQQPGSVECLIHITGGVLAVKKAVVIISGHLQDYSPFRSAPTNLGKPINTAPCSDFTHAEIFPDLKPLLVNLPEDSFHMRGSGCNEAQIGYTDNIYAQREIIFRLLLSLKAAGGVIGKGGSIIRILQNETGASIKAAGLVAGCNDRLFILSAFEKPDTSHSPAQKAVLRVFARCIEAAIENKINMGETLTARLLVDSNQLNYLTEGGATFITELKEVSGAEIKISRGLDLSSFGSETDELVQITGQYQNVQIALLHITGRLRDYCFPNKVLKGVNDRSYPESAIPDINPVFGFSTKSHSSMATVRRHETTTEYSRVTADRGNLYPESTNMSPPMDTVEEIVLPEKAFASVYGEDGRNLKVVKEISGAKVMVDTSPSKSEGKVVISGTPDQIQMAQSLLQAFIGAPF